MTAEVVAARSLFSPAPNSRSTPCSSSRKISKLSLGGAIVGDGDADGDNDVLGEIEADTDSDAETDGEIELLGERLVLGEIDVEALGEIEAEGLTEALALCDADTDGESELLGLTDAGAISDACGEARGLIADDAERDGLTDAETDIDAERNVPGSTTSRTSRKPPRNFSVRM